MSAKLQRCIRLLEAFVLRGDLATREIAKVLECDKQTATRDLRSLQDAGVPIQRVGSGNATRYQLDPAYRRSSVRQSQGDAFALCFGRQLLSFLDETLIAEWYDDLEQKVGQGLSEIARERERRLRQRLHYLSEPYRPYGPHDDAIDELLTALLNTEEIGLRYAASTERTWERLHPLALVMYRRALYLLARFPGQDKVFRLAVDRIVEVTRLKVPFVYPPDFDVASELSSCFGIAETGEAIEEVRLRFAPRVARLVRSRVWHPSQTFVDLDNGGVELRFPGSGRELVRLALEFGETVEVVGPAWLREAVRDELANALAHYT